MTFINNQTFKMLFYKLQNYKCYLKMLSPTHPLSAEGQIFVRMQFLAELSDLK